jgi:hypothetical protein
LAAAYFVFVSRRYAGKVSVNRDNQGFYDTRRSNAPGSSPITSVAHSEIHDITTRTSQHRRN